ncbi:Cell division cycle protein 123 like [Schistosoma japonicum]|nr:Cell division cycle protein 123 like [Schistosoma japonicum]
MKIVDVKRCAFNSWYHTFESYTQDSVFIDLPEDVIASLTNGEFILPKSAKETNGRLSDRSDDRPEFPQFESHLKNIIQDLGGVVFPKLNWSAPCDASWMSCDGSLKCKTFSDIYLLLKSSDFAAHDLTAPFALCTDTSVEQTCCLFNSKPILVLRKWYDFRPEGEFRCFIKSKLLIAICQRKCDAYFKSIEEHIEDIRHDLMEFFNKKIKNRFHLEDYNAYENDVIPTFRYQNDQNIRPNSVNQYSVPIDLVDIASGSDHTKLIDFIQAKVESQKQSQGRVCT